MIAGIPQWRDGPAGAPECDDPADDFFRFRAWVSFGFDVVDYDRWIGGLPPCVAREELVRIRNAAKAALQPDEMKPHLHLIWLSRTTMEGRPRKKPGDVGAATRYLRGEWRPNETARQLWDRLRSIQSGQGQAVYFDGGALIEARSGKEISFGAFKKRLTPSRKG